MDWTQFDKGVFLVATLGIIYNPATKMILIGKRENDNNIQQLSWVFPGGRPDYSNEIEVSLQKKLKADTGLDITVGDIVYAKTYPEKREFLSIYYRCSVIGGYEQVSGSLTALKWVKPSEVVNYFTTSLHPKVLEYLNGLE